MYDHIWHDYDLKDNFTEKLVLEAENLLENFLKVSINSLLVNFIRKKFFILAEISRKRM